MAKIQEYFDHEDRDNEDYQGVDGFAYCDEYNDEFEEFAKTNFGGFELVHEKGGMDEGTHWEKVFYFKELDIYVRIVGSYYSHDGTYFDDGWDCCDQVFPITRPVVSYETEEETNKKNKK